jgi:hypothetical protein
MPSQLLGERETRNETQGNTSKERSAEFSSLPSLAIKLGPYVEDSNGVALRAKRLTL